MIKILACGISRYNDNYNLPFCLNDVKQFCKSFNENIIIDEIKILSKFGKVKKKKFEVKLKEFCDKATKDDVLIYFHSGHGGIDEDNNSYLELTDDIVFIADIVKKLNKSSAESKIIILDACHCDVGMKHMPPINKDNIGEFCENGIAILSSCRKNEVSRSTNGKISVFTDFICKALKNNWLVHEKFIYFQDLQTLISIYAQNYHRSHPGKEQTPVVRTSLIGTVAFPARKYKSKKITDQSLKTEDFEFKKIRCEIKKGNGYKNRKSVRCIVILKKQFEDDIENVLENTVNSLQKNISKIECNKWNDIQNNPIEIIHMTIYKDYFDYEIKVFGYTARWTLHNDINWHYNNKKKCMDEGYISLNINEQYNYFRQKKINYIYTDEELSRFWRNKLKTVTEKIAEFDKKYKEYCAEDIKYKELYEYTINIYRKLNSVFLECDDAHFTMPFSRYKLFHKLALCVSENARSLLQIFLSEKDFKYEYKGKVELELEQYYDSLNKWKIENKRLK